MMIESGNPIGPSRQDELDSLVKYLREVREEEAADAIESLREQVATRDVCMQTLAKEADTWQSLRQLDLAAMVELGRERDAARAKVETVEALLRYPTFELIQRYFIGEHLGSEPWRQEITKLREEVQISHDDHAFVCKERDAFRGELDKCCAEYRAENEKLRALLRDCLPELDGEGVTIHRVWSALAKDAK